MRVVEFLILLNSILKRVENSREKYMCKFIVKFRLLKTELDILICNYYYYRRLRQSSWSFKNCLKQWARRTELF